MILLWEWKKKNYPKVYLEECKYKKIKMTKLTDTELESESQSELESDTEESKSEWESDSEFE